MMRLWVLSIFLFATVGGCDSGTWVDSSPLITGPVCGPDKDKAAKDPNTTEFVNMWARNTCGKSGKAFTGDTRCENGAPQVKCK
jgi:hypothetical protein